MSRAAAVATLAAALASAPAHAQTLTPFRAGMVVTTSTRVVPGTYDAPAPASLDSALIVVRGSGIVLDLTGVVLRGTDVAAAPDEARGVAVRVEGGSGVTLRGLTALGYRFVVLARGTRGLSVVDNELSYGWKPRLFSLREHESLVDWLSYHDNEAGEWLRFGAAIYLEGVRGGLVRGNRAVQGMNGLLMTSSDSVTVRDNDFSYNSGLGIGLYRSSHNVVVRNRLDYDVRGYSEGIYQRGQDSAGLLVYAQSSHNVFAYNSATHSGDGFFLWAGRRTMGTGEGGANDNLIFHNDFGFAPTNAVEVTFSRNVVAGNYLHGSRYGLWGGYSWESVVRGNCFGGNEFGVAIEHGQENVIEQNRFDGDSLAISLWARASEPADWGYARLRDTRSRDHRIRGNTFAGVREVWRLERTGGHEIGENRVLTDVPAEACDPRALLGAAFDSLAPDLPDVPAEIPASPRAALPRSAIVVDEWGPWDGRSPKLWPADTLWSPTRLVVLGPPGAWELSGMEGVGSLSAEAGAVGDTLEVTPAPGRERSWRVDLEYRGERTVSPRGVVAEAGAAVPFAFERFEPAGPWSVRFFVWADTDDAPPSDAVFERTPILERGEARLDYQWFTPRIRGLPQERWAAEATARFTVPPGEHSLLAISDDGVRVWLDGRLVIDHWTPHGSEVDWAPLPSGTHEVRVRYYQLGGWSELRVAAERGRVRSPGSPGPH